MQLSHFLLLVETKFSSRGAKGYTEGVKSLAVPRYDGSRCISFRADKCRAERMWKRSRVNERRRELKERRRVGERVME